MVTGGMSQILLHGAADETFEQAVRTARQLAESFGATLHVVYTVEDPLSAGWTAELSAERLPELHQAMEEEARERLGVLIPPADQERLGVQIALRTGPAVEELVRYTHEHAIDMAIVQSAATSGHGGDVARALLDKGECAVLVLR